MRARLTSLALTGLMLLACGKQPPSEPTAVTGDGYRPPRWTQPEYACSLEDNQAPLPAEPLNEDATVRVPVGLLRPEFAVPVSWGILGGGSPWHWSEPRLSDHDDFVVTLRHLVDGGLELWFVPDYHKGAPIARISLPPPTGGELVAILSIVSYDNLAHAAHYMPDVHGQVALSDRVWQTGDELSIHVEVGGGNGFLMCGDLRVEIPPPGRGASALPLRDEPRFLFNPNPGRSD